MPDGQAECTRQGDTSTDAVDPLSPAVDRLYASETRDRPTADGRTRQTGKVNRTGVRPSPIFLIILAVAVAGGVLVTLDSQSAVDGGTLMLVLGGWGTSLALHEFSHAIVAYRGGDYGVRSKGYLTLDIRRYTDPVFSIVVPLLLLAVGGIPLPGGAVWIDHRALRSRKVESLVSLVGPLSNLVLGVALIWIVRAIPIPDFPSFGVYFLATGLSYLAMLQILAFFLNILPIPGLDGWGAIEPWLSSEARRFGAMVRPWAPLVLFALLIGVAAVNHAVFDFIFWLFNRLGGNQILAEIGQGNFLFWRN
jgi:Zn-dependent protease